MSSNEDFIIPVDIAFFTLPDGNIAHVELVSQGDYYGISRDSIMNQCIQTAAPGSEVRIISTKDYTRNGEGTRYNQMYTNTFTISDNKTINTKDYLNVFWVKFDNANSISEQKQIVSDFIIEHS